MRKREMLFVIVLTTVLLTSLITAEKLGIDLQNKFLESGDLDFKITLYDDANNPVQGTINFIIKNTYSEVIQEGIVNSGEQVNFQLPESAYKGPWELSATYGEIKAKEIFNIGELKKVDIKLEQDYLIVENIGNAFYDNDILIKIGEQDQTAKVYLDIGQTKKIRLTAPQGDYTIRINDGTQEKDLTFSNVPLTGNVVGLERVLEGGFWKKYPMVGLFLSVLSLVAIVVMILKVYQKVSKK